MERACRGDRRALEELCRGEWPVVYRIVAASVGVDSRPRTTQEVFLRGLRRLPHYGSASDSIRPYLVTVAQNLVRDRWRRERRVAWADVELGSLETHEAGPETATLAAERHAELVAALRRLPTLYRTVLRLRLLEGRSAAEVAG